MNFKFVYGFTSKDYPQPSRIRSNTFRELSVDTRFKEAAAFFEMDVDNFQVGTCVHIPIYTYIYARTYVYTDNFQ